MAGAGEVAPRVGVDKEELVGNDEGSVQISPREEGKIQRGKGKRERYRLTHGN